MWLPHCRGSFVAPRSSRRKLGRGTTCCIPRRVSKTRLHPFELSGGYARPDARAAPTERGDPRGARRRAPSRGSPAAAAARRSRASCSGRPTRGRSTASPRRLPLGAALVSATNGKTTTAAMAAEILRPRAAARAQQLPVPTSSRASPRRSSRPAAPSSACSRSTRPPCPRSRGASARGRSCLGNLFRDQLDRYGELELDRRALARGGRRRCPRRVLVVNADDPLLGELARGREPERLYLRPRRPASRAARRSSTRPTRRTASLRDAVRVRRRLRRPPRRLPLPALRARAAAARRGRARDRAARARRQRRSTLATPDGSRRVELALPGLYNVYNATRGRRARDGARACRSPRSRPGSSASRRRSGASSGSPSATGGC